MNDLQIKGKKTLYGMTFHDIEGGFGEGKKAMLVKDIAEIHNRELKDINRRINENANRFKSGIDIIDLKKLSESGAPSFESFGYNKQSVANSSNIYILSERGYAKLLKILEDDTAWEQYELLVDGYFNMRAEIKISDKLRIQEMNAKARLENAKVKKADIFLKLCNVDTLSKEYKNILVSKATEILVGQPLLPLAQSVQKTYSATELGEILGISSKRVGSLANKYNLKIDDYGEWYRDKSPYSPKEVDNFRYYDSAIPAFKDILGV